tara:strand:+ start:38 stop:1468 length:1431 start_codon:yes stop_codon:yes gene_type:complete
MAKEVLELEVKSNIKDVKKDVTSTAAEFEVMGVSLNSVKAGFVSVGRTAKVAFGSIKAGLISTGIGAFIVAIGSLVGYFTNTKKGAELLEKAFAGLGAAVGVIVDRVSKFGGAIVKLFKGDTKGALEDVKGAFSDIGTEIANDTRRAIALKEAFQELRDSQRELNVETAQQRAEIERLKLIAEDVTKSTRERLAAAKEAFQIENDLLARRIANAEEDLKIQQEGMELRKVDGENIAEDLDKEAELKIALADITGESLTKQIELNNKINAITKEGEAIAAEALQARKDADAERMGTLTKMPELVVEVNNELIKADEEYTKIVMGNAKKRTSFTKQLQDQQLAATASFAGALSSLAGDNKQLAAAEALINTYLAVQQTMSDSTIPTTALKFLTAGTVLASGLANVKRIFDTPIPNGTGGGGGGAIASASPQTPSPQMMSGAFELTGGQAPEPLRAYVVTDEMTNSQNQLANIRRRATI